jgi:hypothetical protein
MKKPSPNGGGLFFLVVGEIGVFRVLGVFGVLRLLGGLGIF